MAEELFNSDEAYAEAMERFYMIDAILALDARFTREYLNTLGNSSLEELEVDLLDLRHSA